MSSSTSLPATLDISMTDVEPSSTADSTSISNPSATTSTNSPTATTDDALLPSSQPDGGILLSFGSGMYGLMGSGLTSAGKLDESDVLTPRVFAPFSTKRLTSVSPGAAHALAVGGSSEIYSWGDNSDAALGRGDRSPHESGEIPALQTKLIVASAAGYAHSMALTKVGEVFAFGQGEMAQLGLTKRERQGAPPDLATHPLPALVKELSSFTKIISVACGEYHSLALSSAGRVYSVGDGSRGALGLDFKRSGSGAPATLDSGNGGVRCAVFTEVSSLLPLPISSIAAGAHHSIFVAATGSVYSCGDASKGRLGYTLAAAASTTVQSGTSPSQLSALASSQHHLQWLPRRIPFSDDVHILTASAGAQYTLFLTQCHKVYACGNNSHGELGLPAHVSQSDVPRLLADLPPIIQLTAGQTHALARDAHNQVWGWGSGEMGELGWVNEEGKPVTRSEPRIIPIPKLFEHQHIVSVAAGSNTSYVIVAQTVLGACRVDPNKLVPQSPLTTSTRSYMLFDAASTLPKPALQSRSSSLGEMKDVEMSDATPTAVVAKPTVPNFIVPPAPTPLPLSSFSYSHFLSLVRGGPSSISALIQYISHAFSSALVLNASFLPSASAGGGNYIDTTTLEAVYQAILKVSLTVPRVQQSLSASIQKMLASMVQLVKSGKPPRDVGAYRCVLIVLQSPHLMSPSVFVTQILADISYILTRIPKEVQDVVKNYMYSHIPLTLLHKRFIRALVLNVEHRLQESLTNARAGPHARLRTASEEVISLVGILDGLYESVQRRQNGGTALTADGKSVTVSTTNTSSLIDQNSSGEVTVPDSAWFVDLPRFIDLQSDLEYYETFVQPPQQPPFSFMRHPYLLSPQTKVSYLRTEFAILQQNQVLGATLSGVNPMLQLEVRRTHLIEDVVYALNRYSLWELRRPLKIVFKGEAGEDQGGLTNEFFEIVFKELFQPQYQLWEVRRDLQCFWFSSAPIDPSKASLYQIVGMLLGMCVYNGSSVALNFPPWLYSQLLGETPTLNDLRAVDPVLCRSLEELLRFEGDVENVFCLNFEVSVVERNEQAVAEEVSVVANRRMESGAAAAASTTTVTTLPDEPMEIDTSSSSAPSSNSSSSTSPPAPAVGAANIPQRVRNIELLPGGANMPVTQENKALYVQLYLQHLFTPRAAIQPLIEGFQSIVGKIRNGAAGVGSIAPNITPNLLLNPPAFSRAKSRSRGDTASMSLFTPSDLELLIIGSKNEDQDWNDLKKSTRYEGGYSANHPTIQAFWKIVLEELTPEERTQLLIFTTGSSRIPVGGLQEVRMLIQRAGPNSEALPTSSTCFHALLLPQYDSKEKMKTKLQLALANAVGFGLR